MTTYIKQIEDALFLMESGDTSFQIGPTKQMIIDDTHKKNGITDHKEYYLDGGKGGKLTVYKRKGAYELHHSIDTDTGEVSGKVVPGATDVKKFYGTIKLFGTRVLNSGNPLRIVGNHTNGMFQNYNRMAHIFAKKEGHIVSQPKPYDYDHPTAKDQSEITITKVGNSSPVTELHRNITRSMHKHTIMEYNGSPIAWERTLLDDIVDEIRAEQLTKGMK